MKLAFAVFLWVLSGALFIVALQPGPVHAAERCGWASFYGKAHHGRLQANGKPFNMHAMSAAMWGVPFGTRFLVRNVQNGKTVQIVVSDRGPAKRLKRVVDLSQAAFAKIAPLGQGLAKVCLTRL